MRLFTGLACLLLLSGCGGLAASGVPGVAQVDVLTVMGTDKTLIDHVVSASSGKDCSSVRLEQGDYYCEEDRPKITQNIYCYNTLGSVTCYDRADPRYRKLGQNDHNMVDKKAQQPRLR
ncbi:MAG: hypothetical protein HQ483_11105 [Rhodospirillales bacterium]|nr:hypothetical protein [Rhodospirillales bacterium]